MLIVLINLGMKDDQANMDKHLGERVVIDGDTSTIVGNDIFFDEYTLSNGTIISEEFLNTIKD